MSYREDAITINCAGDQLVGIVAAPQPGPAAEVGVVIVVGGPQVRTGSHRQFTLLARRLASAGFAVLRFDVRGMGDSSGEQRDFESLDEDIDCAVTALMQQQPGLRRVVLWGLCDAASAAVLFVDRGADARIAGLCLLNPWVRSELSLARTRVKHYYLQRLLQGEFWRKLLRGEVARQAAGELLRNLRQARQAQPGAHGKTKVPFQQRMARAWAGFDGPVLLVLSGNDYTAREFVEYTRDDPTWRDNLARSTLTRLELPGADHTFSDAQDRLQVEAATLDWLNSAVRVARPVSVTRPALTSISAEPT